MRNKRKEDAGLMKTTIAILTGATLRETAMAKPAGITKKRSGISRRAVIWFAVLILVVTALCPLAAAPLQTQAKAVTTVKKKQNINMKKLTGKLKRKIAATTPAEKAGSDLTLRHPAARLATARLPQGYTHDDTYYYYISQLANTGKHKNDLRLTRIKYKGFGKYTVDYMTLKQFGHGTNLDCVTVNGVTWLWTGSDPSGSSQNTSTITCFTYRAGTTLRRHGQYTYRIPISGSGGSRYAANCYPAISADGSQLAVRFTNNGGQQFQIYDLTDGTTIHPKKIKKTVRVKSTPGDFQGFDICGTTIYTLEGTRSKGEMRQLGKASSFAPIRIRAYNYKTNSTSTRKIKGAKTISHREPEGIQVASDGTMEIMIASHYKELYTCANIYQVKGGMK